MPAIWVSTQSADSHGCTEPAAIFEGEHGERYRQREYRRYQGVIARALVGHAHQPEQVSGGGDGQRPEDRGSAAEQQEERRGDGQGDVQSQGQRHRQMEPLIGEAKEIGDARFFLEEQLGQARAGAALVHEMGGGHTLGRCHHPEHERQQGKDGPGAVGPGARCKEDAAAFLVEQDEGERESPGEPERVEERRAADRDSGGQGQRDGVAMAGSQDQQQGQGREQCYPGFGTRGARRQHHEIVGREPERGDTAGGRASQFHADGVDHQQRQQRG